MSLFKSGKGYRFFTKFTVICVLLVVLAGSLVKVTGSGMGCPDWPKCFGHYIPPFEEKEVMWNENQEYFEGQMIIANDQLWVAKNNFNSLNKFDSKNWDKYDKHSYTLYNPTHTFIEYVNRLATVVLGLVALLMLVFAFGIRKKSKLPILFSVLIIVLILFEAWLGRLVVDSDLSPVKISIHLYAALLIVAIVGMMLALTGKPVKLPKSLNKKQKTLFVLTLVILGVQMFLGTKVREVFDVFAKTNAFERVNWVAQSGITFLVHRSFSLIFMGLFIYSVFQSKFILQSPSIKRTLMVIASIIFLEVLSGVVMNYFDVPKFLQPVHIFLSGALMLSQTYLTTKLIFKL